MLLFLFAVAVLAGILNDIAGGASLIAFPALCWLESHRLMPMLRMQLLCSLTLLQVRLLIVKN